MLLHSRSGIYSIAPYIVRKLLDSNYACYDRAAVNAQPDPKRMLTCDIALAYECPYFQPRSHYTRRVLRVGHRQAADCYIGIAHCLDLLQPMPVYDVVKGLEA